MQGTVVSCQVTRARAGRRALVVGLGGLLLLAGCSSPPPPAPAAEGGAGGGLVAKAATVDLGRVPFDKQVEARFELTNTGGKPIRLTAQPQVRMLEGC